MKQFRRVKGSSTASSTVWPKEVNLLANQPTFFPRSIGFEDIDAAVHDWFNTRDFTIDNQKTPVVFLTNELWGEFQKQWNLRTFSDHNISMPYVTIRRVALSPAQPTRGRIPHPRRFTTYRVPVYTEAGITHRHYRVPQPVRVDMTYEVRVLTRYTTDINKINEALIRHFASIQSYLDLDGHAMPMTIESIGDESTVTEADVERSLHTVYGIKVAAYIIDEKEFEVVDGSTRVIVDIKETTLGD